MQVAYIHPNAVKTSLQVIVLTPKLNNPDLMQFNRPAALSSLKPGRNLQGGWKTNLCRQIEDEMEAFRKQPNWREKLASLIKGA